MQNLILAEFCSDTNGQSNGQPHCIQSERATLGAVLLNNEAIPTVRAVLSADDFFNPDHAKMFRTITELHAQGEPADAVTLFGRLGGGYVSSITLAMEGTPHVAHVASYAAKVHEMAFRRRRAAELQAEMAAALDVTRPIEIPGRRKRLELIDCAQLDRADFLTDYHVSGVLAKGQGTIAAGGFKTMKTTLLIDLALSVSAGLPFLGKFFTNRCKVGYFCGESGGATTQETARRIARVKGMPLCNFGVHWCFELPQISEPADLQIVEDDVKRLGLELAILDPAYLCMGLADNAAGNLFSVGAKLLPLTRLQESTGCTIVLCHHNKRGVLNPFDPPELADIAWSGFAEWARQWLLLGRRCKYDAEIGGHHELWLNYGGSAGHSGLWAVNVDEGTTQTQGGRFWSVEVIAASSARADAAKEQQEAKQTQRQMEQSAKREKDTETILAKLQAIGTTGETKSLLRDLCGITTQRFNAVFADLLTDKLIESVTVSKGNNREYEGYRLKQNRTRTHSDALGLSDCPTAICTHSDNPPKGGVRPSACVRNG